MALVTSPIISLPSSDGSSALKHPLVSIIVATVNTPRLTKACLESVIRNTTVPYELIVVANSRAQAIRRCLRPFKNIRILQNSENVGYTRAANQGLLASRGDYLCFLNSDAVVPPRWLERLLEGFENPSVGAVGASTHDAGYSFETRAQKGLLYSEASALLADEGIQHWYRGRFRRVRELIGFCWVIPRVVMARIGAFDERFFFGYEDMDYCLRLRLAGYQLLRAKLLFVCHQWHGSVSHRRLSQLVWQSFRRYLEKWEDLSGLTFTDSRIVKKRDVGRMNLMISKSFERRRRRYLNGRSTPSPLLVNHRDFTRRMIRTGLAIRGKPGGRILSLARLSDFETWIPDSLARRIWSHLEGGIAEHGKFFRIFREALGNGTSVRELKQDLRVLEKQRLVKSIQPEHRRNVVVTVMMAAHNAEPWISEAIESVLGQTYPDFELLIGDDGSTDLTSQIVQRYLWHPQLRFFRHERQCGEAVTRNRILSLARGRYLAVCDADDCMLEDLLERFVQILNAQPKVGWVYSDRLKVDANGHFSSMDPALSIGSGRELERNIIAHAGAMIRRDVIEKVGGYDETFLSTEDYDLALKVSERMKVLALPGELHYVWRRHKSAHSLVNPWAKIETAWLLERARRRRKENLIHKGH